ncbi:MAG: J domain-containing protein, partial [Dehalococcoidia bacterium]
RGDPFRWFFGQGGPGPFSGFGAPSVDDLLSDLLGGFRGPFGRTAVRVEVPVEVTLEEAFRGTTRQVEVPGAAYRRLEVKIPPGVHMGSTVRVTPPGGGELHLRVTVRSHPRFQRKRDDLHAEVEVPVEDVILGSQVEVTTLTGKALLKIPPETPNGRVFRLAGQGMPRLGDPHRRGDLYVMVKAALPKALSQRERELYAQLKALRTRRGS